MTLGTDPMGQAARDAALCASLFDARLLAASSDTYTREERRDMLVKVFTQWPQLCRAMTALEGAAPNAAREGYDYAEKLKTLAERARAQPP